MRTKFFNSLLILVFLCIFYVTSANGQDSQNIKMKIGILLTLSGAYAPAGEDLRKGVEAALDISDSRNLFDLTYADSKNDPITAISEFRKMAGSDKVSAIFLNRATIGMPINPISKEFKVPIFGSVGHEHFVPENPYAFQVWLRSNEEGSFLATESFSTGAKKVAIIYTEDEYMSSVTQGFRDAYIKLGGQIVLDESILPSEQDIRSLLIKLKRKAPDTIYINVSISQIAPIVRQIKEFGLNQKILSNFYVAKQDVQNASAPGMLAGIQYAEIDTNLPNLNKVLNVDSKHSTQALTVSSYVAVMLLAQAAKDAASASEEQSLYDSLLKQTEVRTPDHNYKIENRYVKFPLALKVIPPYVGAMATN